MPTLFISLPSLKLRLDMPREGTKTLLMLPEACLLNMIEIRYAPVGDENINSSESFWYFEIRNAT